MRTQLVSGAGGFIGRHLVEHLRKAYPGDKLVSLGLTDPPQPGLEHISCDLSVTDEVVRHLGRIKPDRIYHLAGSARVSNDVGMEDYFRRNFLTTVSLVRAIETLGKPVSLFLASSVHVYGNRPEEVDETSAPYPAGYYGFTKYLAEEALRRGAGGNRRLRVVVGRLYSCIGPHQPEGFVASDICRRLVELPKTDGVLRTGPLEGYRRFLDVRDAVHAFPALLDAAESGDSTFEIYNIASPHELPIRDMVSRLLALSGKAARIESAADAGNPFRGLQLSVAKLRKRLPKHTFRPIDETLKDMLAAAEAARPG